MSGMKSYPGFCDDYKKPFYKGPVLKQPGFNSPSIRGLFSVAQLFFEGPSCFVRNELPGNYVCPLLCPFHDGKNIGNRSSNDVHLNTLL